MLQPFCDEGGCQVIEQRLIGGAFAHNAEIAAAGDDTSTEVSLPDAVYDDPGGEGVFRIREPVGESRTAPRAGQSCRWGEFRIGRIENGKEARLHFFLRGVPRPSRQHKGFGSIGAVIHHGLRERRVRLQGIELFQLSGERVELLLLLRLQFPRHSGILVRDLRQTLEGQQRLIGRTLFRRCVDGVAGAFGEAVHVLVGIGFGNGGHQRVHGIADVFGLRFPLSLLFVRGLKFRACQRNEIVLGAYVSEECLQAVVILVQDGIELVVMALGAAEGHAHKRGAHRVRDVHEQLFAAGFHAGLVGFVRVVAQETSGDVGFHIVRIKLIVCIPQYQNPFNVFLKKGSENQKLINY